MTNKIEITDNEITDFAAYWLDDEVTQSIVDQYPDEVYQELLSDATDYFGGQLTQKKLEKIHEAVLHKFHEEYMSLY